MIMKINGPLLSDYLRFLANKECDKALLRSLFLRNGKVIGLYTACHILDDLMKEEGPLVNSQLLIFRIRTYAQDRARELDLSAGKKKERLLDEVAYLGKAIKHINTFIDATRGRSDNED